MAETLKRYNSSANNGQGGWVNVEPIIIGQNVFGSDDNATTQLLDSDDQINSAFLSNYVDKSSTQTITGAKTFHNTSTDASTIALVLKANNMHLGTNPSSNHFNSINFTDDNNSTVSKFSAIQTSDGWSGFLAGAGSDPTNPQNNLLMIANGNSKLLLIPPTASHGSSAVRKDYYATNTVTGVSFDSTNGKFVYTKNSSNTDIVALDSAISQTSTKPVQNKAIPLYIASRGENLLTNGTGLLGTNYNFSAFTFDKSDTYYAGGCFKHTGGRIEPKTDEYMPVDVSQTYEISYYARSSSSTSTLYDYLAMYDIDKNEISAKHIMWIAGSTTTLAQQLKNGDTKVYLTSVAGFNKNASATYQKGLIFWNYQNSGGYTYGTETYSRNVYTNLWSGSSSFDTTNNTITLASAWNKGTIPAGTSVSQSNDGSTYTYMTTGAAGSTNWFNRKATMSGVGKNNASGKFREGTAFVKLGWLVDQNSEANVTWKLSTLSVAKLIPTTYLKSASVSGSTLTLTKQDNSTVTFTPSGSGSGVTSVNGDIGAITDVAKTNADNHFSADQTIYTGSLKLGGPMATSLYPITLYSGGSDDENVTITLPNQTGTLALLTTITISDSQIVSQSPLVVNLTSEQQAIIEELNNTIIKIDLTTEISTPYGNMPLYKAMELDSPYAWIKRNAVKNIGNTTNGAVLYEFICNNNDIDASANLTKLGNIGIYYFFQTVGTYSTYNKKIIISSAKITLSTLSHATNLVNGSNGGLQMNNSSSGYGSTGERAVSLHNTSLASGAHSVAIGLNNTASGYGSFATGSNNTTSGTYSVSIGNNNSVSGDSSFVSGAYLTSSANYQTVIGKCNVADSNQAFIIGGGSASNDRKNIFTVSDTGYVKCVGLTDGTTTKTLTQVLSASGSSGTPYVSNTSLQQTQNTNTFYDYGNKGVPVTGEIHLSNEQIEFSQGSGSNGIVNEYSGQILADEFDVDLVTPSSIVWSECEGVENNNNVLTLEKNYTYQFSIVNNLGIICRWANGVIEAPVISSFVYPNVTWGAISGATNYNVAILKDSNYIPTPMGGIDTTNTTLNVSNYFSQSQLSTPTNVSASPSSTSIVVTYSSVSNANQYTIYYKTSSASSYSSTTSTSTSKTISGLSANTSYSVYVVANNTSTSTLSARVKAMSPSLVDNTSEAVTCTYNPYTNSSGSTPVTTLTKLSTPSPSISGSVVSWSSISGATYYIVTTSDGHASGNLSATSYNLSTWYDGSSAVNVTVYVTAYSSNNSSAVSNGVAYTITI